MSPTDFTDFPSDPSQMGHLLASDCVGRESNMNDEHAAAAQAWLDADNARIDAAVEAHQNIKHASRDAARRAADAHLWAAAVARELGRSAGEAGTARLAADLAKGGEA